MTGIDHGRASTSAGEALPRRLSRASAPRGLEPRPTVRFDRVMPAASAADPTFRYKRPLQILITNSSSCDGGTGCRRGVIHDSILGSESVPGSTMAVQGPALVTGIASSIDPVRGVRISGVRGVRVFEVLATSLYGDSRDTRATAFRGKPKDFARDRLTVEGCHSQRRNSSWTRSRTRRR